MPSRSPAAARSTSPIADPAPRSTAALLRIGGQIQRVASGIRLGSPAGVALTRDDSTTLATSVFDDTIGSNMGAGGLHRAAAGTTMAWAGIDRPGKVYRVDP